jgi:limonene-1,2-epoxide hydrolase
MPWFPDFVSAAELARSQTRAAGQADPVGQYFAALSAGDTRPLETTWPGDVVVYDPRYGEIRGHKQLRRFVKRSKSWLAERHANTEIVASTCVAGRAVVELLAHLAYEGQKRAWPVAVVAESADAHSVVFRSYFSIGVISGQHHLRPAILTPEPVHPGDVIGRFQAALDAGDTDALVSTFEPEGYYREPEGPPFVHRGAGELRSFFAERFRDGGISQQHCRATDDGERCALEYNCVRWGSHELPAQAGLGVYERGVGGLLAAVRVYDDLEAP